VLTAQAFKHCEAAARRHDLTVTGLVRRYTVRLDAPDGGHGPGSGIDVCSN